MELLRDLSIVNFSRGETIFRTGEPSSALYFIMSDPGSADTALQQNVKEKPQLESGIEHGGDGGWDNTFSFAPNGRKFGEEGLVYR